MISLAARVAKFYAATVGSIDFELKNRLRLLLARMGDCKSKMYSPKGYDIVIGHGFRLEAQLLRRRRHSDGCTCNFPGAPKWSNFNKRTLNSSFSPLISTDTRPGMVRFQFTEQQHISFISTRNSIRMQNRMHLGNCDSPFSLLLSLAL